MEAPAGSLPDPAGQLRRGNPHRRGSPEDEHQVGPLRRHPDQGRRGDRQGPTEGRCRRRHHGRPRQGTGRRQAQGSSRPAREQPVRRGRGNRARGQHLGPILQHVRRQALQGGLGRPRTPQSRQGPRRIPQESAQPGQLRPAGQPGPPPDRDRAIRTGRGQGPAGLEDGRLPGADGRPCRGGSQRSGPGEGRRGGKRSRRGVASRPAGPGDAARRQDPGRRDAERDRRA